MIWNHRVIRHPRPDGSTWLGIHDVMYTDSGVPCTCTADPVFVVGDTAADLTTILNRFRHALTLPIIDIGCFDNAPGPPGPEDAEG